MKILALFGEMHRVIREKQQRNVEIVNADQLYLEDAIPYLDNSKQSFEGILLIDEGIVSPEDQVRDRLFALIKYVDSNYTPRVPIVLVTRDFRLKDLLQPLTADNNLKILLYDYIRLPDMIYEQALEELGSFKGALTHITKADRDDKRGNTVKAGKADQADQANKADINMPGNTPEKTNGILSFFDRFRQKPGQAEEPQGTDKLTQKYGLISKSISRVIVVTGHRGAGLTSTVANSAYVANQRGLSSIIVDMDLEYRSTNLYFGTFDESARKYEDIRSSLIRCLARPQDYQTGAFNVKDKLWLTTLSYAFNDRRLIEQFYTCSKFISLISVLRQNFNVVIVDMPLDVLGLFADAMIHVDAFGLCIPNNLHAVLSTLRNASLRLDQEQLTYLNAKSKVIVTKYNDQARLQGDLFTPDRVCKLMASDLSDNFPIEMPLGGVIPYGSGFDGQIETDVLVAGNSAQYEQAYANTLLRMMEGAN